MIYYNQLVLFTKQNTISKRIVPNLMYSELPCAINSGNKNNL